jgi:peroxiredoxin
MKKFLFSLALLGALINANPTATQTANKTATQQVMKFNLKDVNGENITVVETKNGVKFETLKDKNVILFFYIYDGAPCQKELGILTKYKEKNPDVDVVAIELKGLDREKLKEYAKQKGVNFHMVPGKESMDFVQYIAARASWPGVVPFIIVVDKNGDVQHIQVGLMEEKDFNKVLKK